MHAHNRIRATGLRMEACAQREGPGLSRPLTAESPAEPTLTLSQGFLEQVMLGLQLGDEVPALQVLLHFLEQRKRTKNSQTLEEVKKKKKKSQTLSCTSPFLRGLLVSDPTSTKSDFHFLKTLSIGTAAISYSWWISILLYTLLGAPYRPLSETISRVPHSYLSALWKKSRG